MAIPPFETSYHAKGSANELGGIKTQKFLLGETRAALCFTWTPELRSASERWGALPSMTESGFTTAWQRLMGSVTKERRWQFRDLRAKSATDQDDDEQASSRLGHTSVGITRRIYIRKPRKVAPLDRSLDNGG